MAKKAKPTALPVSGKPEKKQRTREHEIADLSVNFIERLALKGGCVVQRQSPDYGYDLQLQTFTSLGEVEDEDVLLQLKATRPRTGSRRSRSLTKSVFRTHLAPKTFGSGARR